VISIPDFAKQGQTGALDLARRDSDAQVAIFLRMAEPIQTCRW